MPGRQGFVTNGQSFVYQESRTSGSAAFGLDSTDNETWKLKVLTTDGALPNLTPQMEIDPVVNGNIYFSPNDAGVLNVDNDQVATTATAVVIRKSRAIAPITSGDNLGKLSFQAIGVGTTFTEGASISSTNSGTVGANRIAGNLVFSTHPDSASGPTATTRMTIAPTGEITVAAPDSGNTLTLSAFGNGVVLSSGSGVLSSVDPGLANNVLVSNGVGVAPSWQVVPATAGVTAIAGTANEITASSSTGSVTLSIPSTFIAPGTIAATTTVTAGTNLIATAGNLLLPTTSSTVGQIQINSNRFLHSYGTNNTFVGNLAGNFTMNAATANDNVGIGTSVFANLTTGNTSVAIGYQSSNAMTSAVGNVSVGYNSLLANQTGINNTAIGYSAMVSATADNNVAVGNDALFALTSGVRNVALGTAAAPGLLTGTDNIAIGYQSGQNWVGAESGNILIGLGKGTAAESNVTRIGYGSANASVQTKCFIDGIQGVSVSNLNIVTINTATGQLGSQAASATGIITLAGDSGTATGATVTIAGTANEITTAAAGSTVTLSTPSTFIAPGSIASTTTITAATGLTVTAGNATISAGNVTLAQANSGGTVGVVSFNSATWKEYTRGGTHNFFITGGENLALIGSNDNDNIGIGIGALGNLQNNSPGGTRTVAIGTNACSLIYNTQGNVGLGYEASKNHSSAYTVAVGYQALSALTNASSDYTIAIGYQAGSNQSGNVNCANNIYLNSAGVSTETNVLRIGAATGTGTQQLQAAYISGIDGVNVGSVAKVLTMASDQLGTATITAGSGVTVTPTANTITIAATANVAFAYRVVTTTPNTVNGAGVDYYLAVDSTSLAITLKFPDAPAAKTLFVVKDYLGNAATHNITVTSVTGAVTFDGVTSYVMNVNYQAINLIFDGANYQIY